MNGCVRHSLPLLGTALLAAGSLIGSALVLKFTDLSPALRAIAALAPLPFYVVFFIAAVRHTRGLDELKQRMQLEALAFAVIGMLLSTSTYGMLIKADIGVPEQGWDMVWVVTVVFYAAGHLIAWRRYR